MTDSSNILVAIRLLPERNPEIDEAQWNNVASAVKQFLQQSGKEEQNTKELWLFRFSNLLAAYFAIYKSLERVKKEHKWEQSYGPIPLQTLIHLCGPNGATPDEIRSYGSPFWTKLMKERLYVTSTLKNNWHQHQGNKKLPAHQFEDIGDNLFLVHFSSKSSSKAKKLFPFKKLVLQGDMPECFYCGMKSHTPAQCPSKLLTYDMQGINDLGHFNLTDINTNFKKVFSNLEKYVAVFEAGLSHTDIRKDPAKLVFLSYFDVFRIFQPRFLSSLTFTEATSWKNSLDVVKYSQDSTNMAIGIDCLRVGQYQQATEIFEKEINKLWGKSFFAVIGLAFIALETGKLNDMWQHLNKANFLADNEKEKVYVSLLYVRYYIIQNNFKDASKVINQLAVDVKQTDDVSYFQIQVDISHGANEKTFSHLRYIIAEQPSYFLMALMDPKFLPLQILTEETLLTIFQDRKKQAQARLSKVRKQFSQFLLWADQKDKRVQLNVDALNNLEEKNKTNSYLDYLDIIDKIEGLSYACSQLEERHLANLRTTVKRMAAQYNQSIQFWKNYKHKSLFESYHKILKGMKDDISNIQDLVQNGSGSACHNAQEIIAKLEIDFKDIASHQSKMLWSDTAIRGSKIFGKNILILESFLLLVGLITSVISSTASSGATSGSNFMGSSDTFYTIMTIAVLFVAPLTAMCITIFKVSKKNF